jgi:hypothetical protein
MTGDRFQVNVESYSTVFEVKEMIMAKLNINMARFPYYQLYEVCRKKTCIEERFLENEEKIMDILSLWEFESGRFVDEEPDFRLYLRLRLFYRLRNNDVDGVAIFYSQVTK